MSTNSVTSPSSYDPPPPRHAAAAQSSTVKKQLPYAIRPAAESDVPHILALIKDLATYEREPDAVEATESSLLETLTFPSNPSKGYAKTLLLTIPSDTIAHLKPATPTVTNTSFTANGQPGHDYSVAGANEVVVGMALYFNNYSTWTSRPGIFLEDLFVRPEVRGFGFGTTLIRALAKECVDIGGRRLEWSVLKWNKPSIEFYESEVIGARRMDDWVGCRVEGEGLLRLARMAE